MSYFRSEVTSVGVDAAEMLAGGAVIFFGEPCPEELAEISIVHRVDTFDPQRDPREGDVLRVGESRVVITAVGDLAAANLRTLGHMVLYCDPGAEQQLLPGALHADGQLILPSTSATIELSSGDEAHE